MYVRTGWPISAQRLPCPPLWIITSEDAWIKRRSGPSYDGGIRAAPRHMKIAGAVAAEEITTSRSAVATHHGKHQDDGATPNFAQVRNLPSRMGDLSPKRMRNIAPRSFLSDRNWCENFSPTSTRLERKFASRPTLRSDRCGGTAGERLRESQDNYMVMRFPLGGKAGIPTMIGLRSSCRRLMLR